MSHSDKSKGTSVRKGARKAENRELQSRIAEATEAPAPAPAPEPKKDEATDLHAEFQKLTQHAADLETQNGDLDEQLKRAREQVSELGRQLEASRESQKKAEAERDLAKAKADEQERGATGMAEAVAALRKRIDESRAELKKLQGNRDQVEKRAVQSEARAAELDRKVQELSPAAAKTPGLEKDLEASTRDAAKLRAELESLKAEAAELRRQADAAGADGAGIRRQLDASKEEAAQARREAEDLRKKLQDAEAKVAESGRYFGSLEKELLEARESEAKAQKEASQLPDLRSVVSQLENSRREEQRRYKELLQKSTDLERKLTESLFAKPEPPPAPAPAPIVVAESKPSPADSIFDPEPPPAEPPGIAATIPPPQAVPGPSSSPETTLRPQHAFGPTAEDGQPAYVLHEMLPPDPMGVLYRASERASGRQFAVRFMAGQAGEEQTQAIEREVEKLIALPHPNILHVQGSGRRKNRLYLAMDLVLAPTLGRAKIHEIPRICEILRDAAGAVHYAHEEKIFHGDLHLDTILVAKGENGADHALVKDFELAYLMETLLGPASGRDARSPLRNLAYQAPEHVNEAKPTLRASLDVYGLGATLYAALAGKPPFEAKDPAQLRKKVMFEDPVPVEKIRADVPEALAAIVRKAMVKESGLRYATAQAVSDALAKFLDSTHS